MSLNSVFTDLLGTNFVPFNFGHLFSSFSIASFIRRNRISFFSFIRTLLVSFDPYTFSWHYLHPFDFLPLRFLQPIIIISVKWGHEESAFAHLWRDLNSRISYLRWIFDILARFRVGYFNRQRLWNFLSRRNTKLSMESPTLDWVDRQSNHLSFFVVLRER